jgi:hypothetical protein
MTPEFAKWLADNKMTVRNDEVKKDVPWDEHEIRSTLVYTVDADDNYTVEFSPHEHIVLRASALWGTAASRFQHNKMVACQTTILEFKHEARNGRKHWTAKPGIEFWFVVPKAKLELVREKGYSYVPVKLNGVSFRLNVSGGSGKGGWTDWVREHADTCCGFKPKQLRALFDAAMTLEECAAAGVVVDLRGREPCRWQSLVASQQPLQPGHIVCLEKGSSFQGSTGPFTINRKEKQSYLLNLGGGMLGKISPRYIDWLKTIEANNIPLPQPIAWTKLGKIVSEAAA